MWSRAVSSGRAPSTNHGPGAAPNSRNATIPSETSPRGLTVRNLTIAEGDLARQNTRRGG